MNLQFLVWRPKIGSVATEGPRGLVSQRRVLNRVVGKDVPVRVWASVNEDNDQSEGSMRAVKVVTVMSQHFWSLMGFSQGSCDKHVAERIANHYLVRELFCHWNFEIIHFIQLERPMLFCPGTIKGSAKHMRSLFPFLIPLGWQLGKTSQHKR